MGLIRITDHEGRLHELEAIEGWRVIEIVRDHGFDIGGLCGGACACATCHVEVDPSWKPRLVPAHPEEEAMLDEVPQASDTSRLSCQIIYSEALDGLTLRLARAA